MDEWMGNEGYDFGSEGYDFGSYDSAPIDYSYDIAPTPQIPPSWMGSPPMGGMQNPTMGTQQLLGALGGAAPGAMSLLAQLFGGGAGSRQTPQMSSWQRGQQAIMQPGANQLWATGSGLMNQLGQGQNPLQQQQASILSALAPTAANMASGNMQIPPALQQLINKAYDPYIGDITSNAIENARNRGFAGGADLLGGPAGQIAGPGLANAAGMKAQSLLQAMLQFPQGAAQIAGSYNQPINQLAGVAGQSMQPQFNMFANTPYGSQQTQNQNWGQTAGQMLAGAAQGYAAPTQQAQQQQFQNSLLNALQGMGGQSAGGMSGTAYGSQYS